MNTEKISEDAIFKIGKVISVDGRILKVKVDKTKNTSHLLYKGEILKNISVGGYIKIIKGFTKIIGKVEGEFTNEDKQFTKGEYGSDKEKINRILSVSLLGFFKGNDFERGIKELPLIDNECFLLHNKEFDQVHNFIKQSDEPLTIGTLSLEKGQEIKVGVNGLFASHIGIFGNTGSGKSYTLAKIYRDLFEKYKDNKKFKKKAKFFLIDFNGEYVSSAKKDDVIIDKKYKNTYKLSTRDNTGDKFPITPETLNDPDFWVVFLEATEKTQTPFLRRSIENTFLTSRIATEAELRNLIARMIYDATREGDNNLEKTVVINFLKDLGLCLGDNQSISTLHDDYNTNLKFNGTTRNYYYQDVQGTTYGNQAEFKTQIVDAKVAQLQIDLSQVGGIDAIRLKITIQYYDELSEDFPIKSIWRL